MNATEFRAAVEKIIGVPPEQTEDPHWDLLTNHGLLNVSFGVRFSLYLKFLEGPLPGFGENPHSGTWHIYADKLNSDPAAVLRELVNRLSRAGYEPPPREMTDQEAEENADVEDMLLTRDIETFFAECKTWVGGASMEDTCEAMIRFAKRAKELHLRMSGMSKPGVPATGLVIGLTEEERRVLRDLTSKAFQNRETFHRIAGQPGKQEHDTERVLRGIHEKLKP